MRRDRELFPGQPPGLLQCPLPDPRSDRSPPDPFCSLGLRPFPADRWDSGFPGTIPGVKSPFRSEENPLSVNPNPPGSLGADPTARLHHSLGLSLIPAPSRDPSVGPSSPNGAELGISRAGWGSKDKISRGEERDPSGNVPREAGNARDGASPPLRCFRARHTSMICTPSS